MVQIIMKTKWEVNELFNLYSKIQMLVTNDAAQGISLHKKDFLLILKNKNKNK